MPRQVVLCLDSVLTCWPMPMIWCYLLHRGLVCRPGLVNILVAAADEIGLTLNAKKTVAMIFNPTDGRKCLSIAFPNFTVGDKNLTCYVFQVFRTHYRKYFM